MRKGRLHAERSNYGGHEKAGANAQHSEYSGDMETLFAKIDSIKDNEHRPAYWDATELTQRCKDYT